MHLGTLNIVSSGYPRLWNPSNLHIWWHSGFRGWLRNPSSKEGILQPTWTAGRCVTLSSLEFSPRLICVFPPAVTPKKPGSESINFSYLLCFFAGPTKKLLMNICPICRTWRIVTPRHFLETKMKQSTHPRITFFFDTVNDTSVLCSKARPFTCIFCFPLDTLAVTRSFIWSSFDNLLTNIELFQTLKGISWSVTPMISAKWMLRTVLKERELWTLNWKPTRTWGYYRK